MKFPHSETPLRIDGVDCGRPEWENSINRCASYASRRNPFSYCRPNLPGLRCLAEPDF